MTDEEMRIAIAKAVGWTAGVGIKFDTLAPYGCPPGGDPKKDWRRVPDFLNDLNAIHGAEKVLPETRRGYYNAELFKLSTGRNLASAIKEPEFIFRALNATARQRAEAFLKTLGLWK